LTEEFDTVTRFGLLAVVAMFLLGGCAAMPQKTPEDAVRARVEAHQKARLENNFELAYTFTSPGYRETHAYKFYLGKMGAAVKRHGYEIKEVSCEADACNVNIELSYSYLGKAGAKMGKDTVMQRQMTEKWIRVDGEWWLMPER
jgi:negative regulator of sigma E activity